MRKDATTRPEKIIQKPFDLDQNTFKTAENINQFCVEGIAKQFDEDQVKTTPAGNQQSRFVKLILNEDWI